MRRWQHSNFSRTNRSEGTLSCRRPCLLRRVAHQKRSNAPEKVHRQRDLIFNPSCRRICMVVVQWAERPQRSPELHPSIEKYLEVLHTNRRAPATLKVIRQDLIHFVACVPTTRRRMFNLVVLRHEDLRDWRLAHRRDNGAAPATINRGLASLRGYC